MGRGHHPGTPRASKADFGEGNPRNENRLRHFDTGGKGGRIQQDGTEAGRRSELGGANAAQVKSPGEKKTEVGNRAPNMKSLPRYWATVGGST